LFKTLIEQTEAAACCSPSSELKHIGKKGASLSCISSGSSPQALKCMWPSVRDCCHGVISPAFVQQPLHISRLLRFPVCICLLCEVVLSRNLISRGIFCGKFTYL